MPRILDNIALDLLKRFGLPWKTWAFVPSGLLGDLGKPKFIQVHAKGDGNGGNAKSCISIYGQAPNYTIGHSPE